MTHLLDLETLTLALGITGAGFAIWGLFSAVTDMNYLTASGLNGPRRIVAVNNLTRQAFRMAQQTAVIAGGTFAVMNQAYSHERETLSLLCLIDLGSALVLIPDVIDRLRRVQLDRIYDELSADARIGRRRTDAILAAVCKHEDKRS